MLQGDTGLPLTVRAKGSDIPVLVGLSTVSKNDFAVKYLANGAWY
jgi:hypothetical protein